MAKTLVTPGKCWIWQGDRAGADDAYGIISVDGRSKYVHRFAYELWIGPIPDGYEVDHVRSRGCSSTVCINPQHLEAVTPVENRRRSESVSEVNKSKTHCIHGHEFTPANTVLTRRGHRRCRSCAQAAEARKTGNPEWQAREAAYRRELRARRRRAAKAGRV